MRSKFKWIFTLLVALSMQFAFAQEKTVTGVLSGSKGPLAGVNVKIKGSTTKTQSDFDGKFSIKANVGDVLLFTFTGMKDQSRVVGASNTFNILMADEVNQLADVVVQQGYKSSSKTKSNISQATVTAKTIEGRPNVNVLQSLQGQVAGLNISSASGSPGTNKVDVIIRGESSINASSDPLYVIDGIPQTQGFFRTLNPNDIESSTILKDAGATAVYGNRGANGVIVINTKKGTYKDSFTVRYSSNYGYTEFNGENYNRVNAKEQLQLQNLMGLGFGATLTQAQINDWKIDTDWKPIFFRKGESKSHDLSFTTGSDNMNNFTSIGYFEQDGIVRNTDFRRLNFRSNFNGKTKNDKFNYQANFSAIYSKRNQLEQETRAGINGNVLQNPLNGYLNSVAYLDPSVYVNGQQLFNDFGAPAGAIVPYMLMDYLTEGNIPSFFEEVKLQAVLGGTYKFNKNLSFNSTTGIDYANDKRVFARAPQSYLAIAAASSAGQQFPGFEQQRDAREFMFTITNKLVFNKVFAEKHTLDAGIYQELIKGHRRVNVFSQNGLNGLTYFPGAGTGWVPFNPATPTFYAPTVAAGRSDAGLLSYFATADYDYDSRFGVSTSLRRDGSYRFVGDNKWGTFYSAAVRWNLHKEKFLLDTKVDELKLRASYGTTGNQNVVSRDVDADASTLFSGNQIVRSLNSAQTGYGNVPSFGVSVIGNSDLKWETVAQANVGVDFGFFKRLTGSLDFYRKTTTDIYLPTLVSLSTTLSSINANNGALQNQGVELSLNYSIIRDKQFKLSVFANGSFNENKITDLGRLAPGIDKLRVGNDFANAVDGPVSQYFVVPYVGVDPATGEALFLDINNNVTSTVTDSDRRLTGKNYLPLFQGGFGLNASYKGFSLYMLCSYAQDFYKFDSELQGLTDITNVDFYPVTRDLLNAWTPQNTMTDVPSLNAANLTIANSTLSDRFLRDASYIRFRNITFAYSVPSQFLEKTFIKSLKFNVQGENLFTITKWRGFDPENFDADGVGKFPTPKSYTFGIDIQF